MNWAMANMVICKAISHGKKVYGHPVGDDHFLATADGVVGYVFRRDRIAFNLESVTACKKQLPDDVYEFANRKDEQLKISRLFITLDSGDGFARRFFGKDYDTWIKVKYLKGFNNTAEFYQRTDDPRVSKAAQLICIVEDGETVGVVCPVRIHNPELEDEIERLGAYYT